MDKRLVKQLFQGRVNELRRGLETLKSRIKTLIPTTLCHIGEAVVHDARQIHASFLKTPQDETLDLCILLRFIGNTFVVSGDLVKGGSGKVLSEMEPITSPAQGEETEPFGQHICQYVLEQEDTLVKALR